MVLQGELTHGLLKATADDDDTWLHTDRDLRAIAGPATRILNRYDASRAAAALGDEGLLAIGVGKYVLLNVQKRQRYRALAADQAPVPVTGAHAPDGTGPDPEWLAAQEQPGRPLAPPIPPRRS